MRKLFAKIHLWLSIPFGIIIAIVCLTGAILVFETEIQELCHPSHYFVKEVKGEPLLPAALIESARRQLPDSIKINGIRVTPDPKRTTNWCCRAKRPPPSSTLTPQKSPASTTDRVSSCR